jgi:hypothetical protein
MGNVAGITSGNTDDVAGSWIRQTPDLRSGQATDPEVEKLMTVAGKAQETANKMYALLEKFYAGDITAGMLAANPALQLWMQQALQFENRLMTAISNILREAHETSKHILGNIRG